MSYRILMLILSCGVMTEVCALQAQDNAARISMDISGNDRKEWKSAPAIYYTVPAMSRIMRLSDTYPEDGEFAGNLRFVAARNEFEPASFVVCGLKNTDKFELVKSDLKGPSGSVIPASALDLKVVKIWSQSITAWDSYFNDSTAFKLVPELLLNDENLIRVDEKSLDNYLRVERNGRTEYIWVSYPADRISVGNFNFMLEKVADAPILQPVKIEKNRFKQFWATIKVPQDALPGIYEGVITATADGKNAFAIPVAVRVLPFELPEPKTYCDLNIRFISMLNTHASLYKFMSANGNDFDKAKTRLRYEFKNMLDHNFTDLWITESRSGHGVKNEKYFREALNAVRESGGKYTLGEVDAWSRLELVDESKYPKYMRDMLIDSLLKDAESASRIRKEILGDGSIMSSGFDEPPIKILIREREAWKNLHDLKGFGTYSPGSRKHLIYAGYNEDWIGCAGGYPKREDSAPWNALGTAITMYANPCHTGNENPDFVRRTHGMLLYHANYTGTANYHYSEGVTPNIWNENLGVGKGFGFRSFCMVYPTQNGLVDTIAWEGYREGLDDIRYATKLKMLAAEAMDRHAKAGGADLLYTARLALKWLELRDFNKCDMNNSRLEMINHILKLQDVLEKGKAK